jgi:hypothetical protein
MEPFITGVNCTYFGRGLNGNVDQVCPFCSGATQVVDEAEFWKRIDGFEAGRYEFALLAKAGTPVPEGWQPKPHPGYAGMFKWAQAENRCFKHVAHMKNSFAKHTGTVVDLTL